MSKPKLISLLTEILALTSRLGGLRVFVIGIIFPEYRDILGKLEDISREVESAK